MNEPDQTELGLSAKDATACDALVDAGFDSARVPASAERRRVSRLVSLLGLLRAGARPDSVLVDVTLARVMQARGAEAGREQVLSGDDQEALDALVMSGFDATRVPASLRDRARKQVALLSALSGPVASSGDLIEKTLSRVREHIDRAQDGMRIETARSRRGSGLRLADIVSVAAVILVGCGVLFPVLTSMREQSRRALCKSNLGATAQGMSTYAGANRDSLPVSTASLAPGGTWWDVGRDVGKAPTSNSANLYTLARAGYVPLASLACPGNPAAPTARVQPGTQDWRRLEEISYSYQIMFGPQRAGWRDGEPAVILADRSPVVLAAFRGEAIDPCSNAPNHGCEGEHLLRTDGSVVWATSPLLANGDNIWLPRSVELRLRQLGKGPPLTGNEMPSGADDTFLGP